MPETGETKNKNNKKQNPRPKAPGAFFFFFSTSAPRRPRAVAQLLEAMDRARELLGFLEAPLSGRRLRRSPVAGGASRRVFSRGKPPKTGRAVGRTVLLPLSCDGRPADTRPLAARNMFVCVYCVCFFCFSLVGFSGNPFHCWRYVILSSGRIRKWKKSELPNGPSNPSTVGSQAPLRKHHRRRYP